MVFWFLLFWSRRETNTTSGEAKIGKPIPPLQNQSNVSCITLFNKGMQARLDLHDLFCVYVFESESPVGKLWLQTHGPVLLLPLFNPLAMLVIFYLQSKYKWCSVCPRLLAALNSGCGNWPQLTLQSWVSFHHFIVQGDYTLGWQADKWRKKWDKMENRENTWDREVEKKQGKEYEEEGRYSS